MEKLKPQLKGEFTDGTIRTHFSVMSREATSPIAKVEHGHGYYLRALTDTSDSPTNENSQSEVRSTAPGASLLEAHPRELQLEEKFRALFMRYVRLENRFPMHVEHTQGARQAAGVNRWKFPDVILVEWDAGEATDSGYTLNHAVLEVKRSLGEQPFRFTSVELKVEATLGSFREQFFQCVSNSRWAHNAELVFATAITDTVLANELRRLGSSYGVAVSSFGMTTEQLVALPSATEIAKLAESELEALTQGLSIVSISSGQSREYLDWEHLRDMVAQSTHFADLLNWVSRCLQDKRAYSYSSFQDLQRIERAP